MTDGGGVEPKTIPRLADLVGHLSTRSRKPQEPKLHPPAADLVAEVAARGWEPSQEEADWLGDPVIWPGPVTGRLVAIVDLLESLGVAYDIDFKHDEQGTPAEITSVVIQLAGD
ncbi:hypothetical protein [Nocardioides sp. cx-173]|uniref:hypothetical protein n=1 Tax=Nocardioides sp. cx-173 TaxID=2898796 RepID=UPI001E48744A|nr:hypothetical protein [Nocardioides sp. cx-173]MCD4526154.1 hypothetical protein [Nocardioides sp. cx-173]UGB40630.1 hypothetical protein LQ940_14755 [Nocardioides sp. cx-173]